LGAGVTVAAGGTVVAFTVTPVAVTAGIVNVSLSEAQTDQLASNGKYRWWFRTITPGNVTRTILSGDVTSRAP
jgi:ABC-type branched-subunit amino acid transport system substrate-binding protein